MQLNFIYKNLKIVFQDKCMKAIIKVQSINSLNTLPMTCKLKWSKIKVLIDLSRRTEYSLIYQAAFPTHFESCYQKKRFW